MHRNTSDMVFVFLHEEERHVLFAFKSSVIPAGTELDQVSLSNTIIATFQYDSSFYGPEKHCIEHCRIFDTSGC